MYTSFELCTHFKSLKCKIVGTLPPKTFVMY